MKPIILILFCTIYSSLAFGLEIKTAYQDVYPKYIISNDNGKIELSGLCIEIENAIEKTDPTIKFVFAAEYLPFTRIEGGLNNGSVEAFCGLTKTKERLEKYQFIYDLYQTGNRLVARADETAQIESLSDIRKLGEDVIILALFGTAQSMYLKDQGFHVDDGGKTVDSNIQKLLKGHGRFFYQSDLSVFGTIREYGYSGKVKVYPTIINKDWQCFVFAKNAPKEKVISVKNALDDLQKSGALNRIIQKYFSEKNQ